MANSTSAEDNISIRSSILSEYSPEERITLMRVLARRRPVGVHKHIRMMFTIQDAMEDLERPIRADDLWDFMNELYVVENLDALDAELWAKDRRLKGMEPAGLLEKAEKARLRENLFGEKWLKKQPFMDFPESVAESFEREIRELELVVDDADNTGLAEKMDIDTVE